MPCSGTHPHTNTAEQTHSQTTIPLTLSEYKPVKNKLKVHEYKPDSIWSNIKYGTGMLAFMTIPPFIPGVTVRGLVFFYVGSALSIYILVYIMGIARFLKKELVSPKIRR